MLHHRKEQRLPSAYSARISVPALNIGAEVWIKDVSLRGLKLLGVPFLEPGARIEVQVERLHVEGTVRWWREQMVGVALDRNLSHEEIAMIRHLRIRTHKPGQRHNLNFREMR